MHIFKNSNFNFLRWRWQAMALSAVVIVAGVTLMATRGIPLGVEFSGGTIVIVKFESPVSEQRVRDVVQGEEVVQQYGDPTANQVLVRLPQDPQVEQGGASSWF